MKNEERFKTVEEREEAFNLMCCARQCSECKYRQIEGRHWCSFAWLSDEYEEPKPDLPFEVADKVVGGCYIEVVRRTDTKEEVSSFPDASKFQCDRLNAAALAWHERMKKEKGVNK